jgi:hypothetical protein
VALERQNIEKRDFPIGRRGYDPEAVDAHLSALAAEVEQLKLASRQARPETVSSAASEQVRAILEAAEATAADLQRQAEDEAREIRAQAAADAQAARERATSQARDYVGRVSESAGVMLQRLDAMESEIGAVLEMLRSGGERLRSDLGLLDINLVDVREAVEVRPRREPEADVAAVEFAGISSADSDEAVVLATVEAPAVLEPAADPAAVIEIARAAVAQPAEAAATVAEDDEGARLIALNMALNGTPRAETERYLADNFELSDRASLLDDVYASVES